MTPLIEAFASPRADDLFVSIAAVPDAHELQEIDVPEAQREAHVAIAAAVFHASQRLPSPGSRVALVRGDPGSGKTHVLTTALERATTPRGDVYPVVLQLSAPVAKEDYESWLLEALFRELSARYFGRSTGESPLRRLVRRLLEALPPERADALRRAVDEGQGQIEVALACGRMLRQLPVATTEDPPHAGFLAAILLAGLGDWSAMRWLRRGEVDERLAALDLRPHASPHERLAVVRDFGLALQLVSGALAIGFDQVENTVRLAGEELFVHALVQAVRIAEQVVNVALVIAVLGPEYDRMTAGRLPESDRDRIERERPAAAAIGTPSARILERVIGQRLAVLRSREGLATADPSLDPLPAWFVQRLGEMRTVRVALREVNRLRERTAELGRLPESSEFERPSPEAGGPDFEKLWADHRDQQVTAEDEPADLVKIERLQWWIERAVEERGLIDDVKVTLRPPEADDVHVLELELAGAEGPILRQVGLCEAKGGGLPRQIEAFVERCVGHPVAVRTGPFPSQGLKALQLRRGSALELTTLDWHLLGQAQVFESLHKVNAEFLRWRQRAQWHVQLLPDPGPLLRFEVVGVDAEAFPVVIGVDAERAEEVVWDPFRAPPDVLNNYGFLVTGDAGTGKTRTLRKIVEAATKRGLPLCVIDWRGHYEAPEVLDLSRGLPFGLLEPPPGSAAVTHAYDVAGILTRVYAFGPVQETLLRNAIVGVSRAGGRLGLAEVLDALRQDAKAGPVVDQLEPFVQLGLGERAPGVPELGSLLGRQVVLRVGGIATDELQRAIVETLIVQLCGHLLRGETAAAFKRLVVLDEAHRMKQSRRLETLARDGRTYGVGLALGAPAPADLPDELVAAHATQLYLWNAQAEQRNWVARKLHGTLASEGARATVQRLSALRPGEGVFVNVHHAPFRWVRLS